MVDSAPSHPRYIVVHGYPQKQILYTHSLLTGGMLEADPNAIALVAVGKIGWGQPDMGEEIVHNVKSRFPRIDPSRIQVISKAKSTLGELEAVGRFVGMHQTSEIALFCFKSHQRRIEQMLPDCLTEEVLQANNFKFLTTSKAAGLVNPALALEALSYLPPEVEAARERYDERLYAKEGTALRRRVIAQGSVVFASLGGKHLAEAWFRR